MIKICGYLRKRVLQCCWVKSVTAFYFKGPQSRRTHNANLCAKGANKQPNFLAGKATEYRQTLSLPCLCYGLFLQIICPRTAAQDGAESLGHV